MRTPRAAITEFDQIAKCFEVALKVLLRLDDEFQADHQILKSLHKLKHVFVVELSLRSELNKLFDDLISKPCKLSLRKRAQVSRATLLIEVLDKDALDSQLCAVDRVFKVADLF
eukprot:CAMPEP_0185575052 /NCGR_PEP_ID=MMETSP0434-20130131/6350_1 /TAXON_ID=626734 ORGANISM="Favella taraikaensis, Strain Fe Narragansett Bay" /NCGR_SAMPLE_ID=MMETSP0434 /ASSEMBLY_ACC=CAM_ASM_000379 /LENGTH=113 /DNA_ID=CAMNT_0028191813 /DNA_START=2306 /DNA_END=2645 /DNA_ORIENTATION=-